MNFSIVTDVWLKINCTIREPLNVHIHRFEMLFNVPFLCTDMWNARYIELQRNHISYSFFFTYIEEFLWGKQNNQKGSSHSPLRFAYISFECVLIWPSYVSVPVSWIILILWYFDIFWQNNNNRLYVHTLKKYIKNCTYTRTIPTISFFYRLKFNIDAFSTVAFIKNCLQWQWIQIDFIQLWLSSSIENFRRNRQNIDWIFGCLSHIYCYKYNAGIL